MAINPFTIRDLQLPAPLKTQAIDFSPLQGLGAGIGAYRRQQDIGSILAGATDASGNLDPMRAFTEMGKRGYVKEAEDFLQGAIRQQALKQSAEQHAATERRLDEQAKTAQSQWQQTFNRAGESPFSKVAQDLNLRPGTPEYLEAAKLYHQPKTEGDWSVVQVPHPQYPGETIPMWGNKRTQEIKPFTGLGTAPGAAPVGATTGQGAAPAAGGTPAAPAGGIPPAPPGSDPKEWRKEQTKFAVQQRAREEAKTKQAASIDPVAEDIDLAIAEAVKYPGMVTGGFGALMANVPYSRAHDVSKLIDTVKSSASLEKLNELKAASPTGASGLGSVTLPEHKMLQGAIGSLEQSQTATQFLRNLERVKRIRHEIIHGPGTAPPPQFGVTEGQRAPQAAGGGQQKTIGGKSYSKRNGQWYED